MQNMIAYCGIICNECPAFIATQKNDENEKKRLAQLWSSKEVPLLPEDIECDGCLLEGKRLTKFCYVCAVRKCAIEKGVENCAYCGEYICDKLDKLLKDLNVPEAKETLDKIKRGLSK